MRRNDIGWEKCSKISVPDTIAHFWCDCLTMRKVSRLYMQVTERLELSCCQTGFGMLRPRAFVMSRMKLVKFAPFYPQCQSSCRSGVSSKEEFAPNITQQLVMHHGVRPGVSLAIQCHRPCSVTDNTSPKRCSPSL
jgi:hypothetical protein